jgi:hypothetical protein
MLLMSRATCPITHTSNLDAIHHFPVLHALRRVAPPAERFGPQIEGGRRHSIIAASRFGAISR